MKQDGSDMYGDLRNTGEHHMETVLKTIQTTMVKQNKKRPQDDWDRERRRNSNEQRKK